MRTKIFTGIFLFLTVMVFCVFLYQTDFNFRPTAPRSNNSCRKNLVQIAPLKDFHNYPCLDYKAYWIPKGLAGECVRTVCKEDADSYDRFIDRCVPLRNVKSSICTYDPQTDLVSRHIHEKKAWEPELVDSMTQILKAYPEMTFLDLGCNIGVYTIAAASVQTKCFCVDANHENLRLVSKSISLGHLENFVTLIWNALSDQKGEVTFKVVKGNVGASRIGDTDKYNMKIVKNISVNAIMLDNLLSLFRGKQVFMKIDLESYELNVLKGGLEFFKHVDVRIIQMELVEKETFEEVVDLLYSWGFLMFRDPGAKNRLKRKDFRQASWPGDIYFIKLTHLHGQ